MKEVERYNLDITVLTETKKKGSGNESLGNYTHIWSGVDKSQRARSGVSILIHNKLKRYIKDYQYITDRIILLKLKMYGYNLNIIGVYAPVDSENNQTKDQFYEDLTKTMSSINPSYDVIIAGDLNARVKSQTNNVTVGNYAEDVENDNGERVLELCNQFDLKLTNTFFPHKDIHRFTWERPSLNQKSIIDYIITKVQSTFKIYDTRVKRGANCDTDHHLLTTKIVYPFSSKNNKNLQTYPTDEDKIEIKMKRYKTYLFQHESIKELYQRRLHNELLTLEPTEDIEQEYERIKKVIHKVAQETLGEYKWEEKKTCRYYITEELKELIEEKNRLHQKYLTYKSETTRAEYKEKNREVRKKIKKEKNEYWERKCAQINTYIGGAQSTEVWQTIKNMKTNNKERAVNLIPLEEWKNYYEILLTENRQEFLSIEDNESEDTEGKDWDEITMEEVQANLKTMKNGRAAGPGDISAEMIKNGGITMWRTITSLINNCISQGRTPTEWKKSYISSIYKKGNRKDPNNYRGICVTSTMSRLYGKILQNRIRETIKGKISENQSGFTPGRSCIDNLFTLQQLIEKKIQKDDEIHMTFIDLKKAYDSVPRNKLWHVLRTVGIKEGMITTIKELYNENIGYVKQGRYLSEAIHITKGLRQGCCLSPILFNIFVDNALKKWNRTCQSMGIPISDKHLLSLNFADDQVIITQDAFDMEYVLKRLYTDYKEWGLEVSLEKTEYMVMNSEIEFDVLINNDTHVKQVKEFKYLGVLIDNKNGIGKKEIQNKIQKARRIIGALNSIWWDQNITTQNKKRIGRTMVESVLSYGSELWVMKEEDKRKITTIEMDYLRRSAGVSKFQHITNQEIRNRTAATETIIQRIENRGLKWFGHLLRMNDTRWPKRLLTWKPPGRNKKGRPRRSWNEDMRQAMRSRGMDEEMADDREVWRRRMGTQHLVV